MKATPTSIPSVLIIEPRVLKGFRDYLPQDETARRALMEILERVGLAEVGEGCWGVYFGRQLLGIVDEPARKVVDAGEAVRKGRVSESALRSPFRYAPGAPEGAPNM